MLQILSTLTLTKILRFPIIFAVFVSVDFGLCANRALEELNENRFKWCQQNAEILNQFLYLSPDVSDIYGSVDEMQHNLISTLLNAGRESGMIFEIGKHNNGKRGKWYDSECAEMKRSVKHNLKLCKADVFGRTSLECYHSSKKLYKQILTDKRLNYEKISY